MRRGVVVIAIAVAALLVPAAPAAACSSDESKPDVRALLFKSDGAFVGRFVKRKGGLLVYRVDTRVKGRIGRRVRVRPLRDCGPVTPKGRRVGMLLDRWNGRWEAHAFSVFTPGELLKAAGIGP